MVTTGYVEREAAVGGLKLHYQEWGNPSAPTIVMLHGFGVSGHMFDEFAERMQDRFHLIALDQRGHGDSDWSEEGDYSRDAFVSDLEGFCQALGLDRFILIGHSMGGLNSVAFTAQHPGRVRALVLVDVGPEAARDGVDNIIRFTRGPDELDFDEFVEMAHRFNQRRTIENIRERMRHRLKPTGDGKWTWKFDRRFRQADSGLTIGSGLSNDEMWHLYRSVAVPVLLVRGSESDVLSQDVAERAAREMRSARLVVVPGAGHSVPGDNPDDFTAAVVEFIEDLMVGRVAAPVQEAPSLDELVETRLSRRRRPSFMLLVLAGLGAALAAGGVAYALNRRSHNRKREAERPMPASPSSRRRRGADAVRNVDIEQARRRALDLSRELAGAGRKGIAQARGVAHDVEVERAREAALDVLHALGERARSAEGAAAGALQRVDREKLKRRSRGAARRSGTAGWTALQLALAAAPRLASLASRSRANSRGSRR
ncbi:alpha/beta hydrolase [bacterium]|nr:MAG: alpha/beta hydrolase [bacterium]MCL4229953.1 alpha/beta hydrolase [Dehalococcoidia bacterium]